MGKIKTKFQMQEMMNFSLDDAVHPPLLTYGQKQYHPSGGWIAAPAGGTYPYEQYEWSGGNVIYKGLNTAIAAADATADWLVYKFTYDVNDQVTKIQSQVTSWTNRSSGW